MFKYVLRWCIFNSCACALAHSYLWFRAFISLVFFHMVRAGAYWHTCHPRMCIHGVHKIVRYFVLHCKTFNKNAEKPKFYSSTVVYFTLAGLLGNLKVQEVKFRDCQWCIWSILLLSSLMIFSRYFKAVGCFSQSKMRFLTLHNSKLHRRTTVHNLTMP